MKKKLLFLTTLLITSMSMYSQELTEIKLNAPDKTRGSAVMKALDRNSTRLNSSH